MRKLYTLILILFVSFTAHAQHTFSMIAVDTVTKEIGAAGATCLSEKNLGSLLDRIVPGRGAINAQAWLSALNRDYGVTLLQKGYSAQQVLDSIYANDEMQDPEDRQNLVLDFQNGHARTAGFTGDYCYSYAGHRVGPNYVIAGNILAGPQVLDSMENAFNRTKGGLADKLMAALMAAKFPGADSRCQTTSSMSAFIRLAKPWDAIEHYTLDVSVMATTDKLFEPIDTLHARYMELKLSGFKPKSREQMELKLYPNPATDLVFVEIKGFGSGQPLMIQLEDLTGKIIGKFPAASGHNKMTPIPIQALRPGLYIINVNGYRIKLVKS